MDNFNQEIPKYKKNTGSNISKIKKRSKHKHQYEECLIQYNMKIGLISKPTALTTSLGSYCTICGKIGDRFKEENSIVKDYRRIVETPIGRCYQMISSEELYEKYHNKMPVFFVADVVKEKYVDLE
jgi:hypothetical protein|uniref:Uncharacterized protein n=1 Tax=Siphoviridae sp. cttFh17 TaxID=2826491 RepID=A0A8S5NJY6_9CAUD|nr:MAG TPA: hypothetical protein [Siphoviridae sp. cttFh17]DAH71367.1 MAG TPA: hypothetical protein [Caudoviricetes sp.]DAU04541.1 MAG TPA: hypothetical protein [Caudoviricetes sp.]